MTAIRLTVTPHHSQTGCPYQHLTLGLGTADGIIYPHHLKTLTLPTAINWHQGIVLEGQAPLWLYSHLVSRCQLAPWIACFDPRLGNADHSGAVVVSSRSPQIQIGSIIPLTLPLPFPATDP
jgi:CRISPR-associated protein Csx3